MHMHAHRIFVFLTLIRALDDIMTLERIAAVTIHNIGCNALQQYAYKYVENILYRTYIL